MKDQYLGDIGDFGKFLLLRYLLYECNIKLGINWYLTDNDNRNDGLVIDYLIKDNGYDFSKCVEEHSRIIYLGLGDIIWGDYIKHLQDLNRENKQSIVKRNTKEHLVNIINNRTILNFQEQAKLIFGVKANNITFYPNRIRTIGRDTWFKKSVEIFKDCNLIFLDPDNGLTKNENNSRTKSTKHIYINEINDYLITGKNVVFYHHCRMRDYIKNTKKFILQSLSNKEYYIKILRFRRGSPRLFVFVLHKNENNIIKAIEEFNNIFIGKSKQKKHFELI